MAGIDLGFRSGVICIIEHWGSLSTLASWFVAGGEWKGEKDAPMYHTKLGLDGCTYVEDAGSVRKKKNRLVQQHHHTLHSCTRIANLAKDDPLVLDRKTHEFSRIRCPWS